MDSQILDYFMVAILGFCVIMFYTGNGEKLMDMFGGNKVDTSHIDRPKLIFASKILCTELLINELLLLFLGNRFPWIAIVTVILTIVGLVVYTVYLKKYAQK